MRSTGVDGDDVLTAIESKTYRPRVRADFDSGVRSGVNGTPTFFINGARFDGDWEDEETFAAALNAAASGRVATP
jgi:protein-disulfide isomerase